MTQYTKDLASKLGFEPGDTIYVEITPDWYSDFIDENGLDMEPGLPATHAHIFCEHEAALSDFLEYNSLDDIEKSLWISWPKHTSGKQTDLGEDMIREAILPLGWVDVKVAAIDDMWSGLQFVRRSQ